MNSDISVIVSGLPFDQAGITGVTIHYGYNMIPYAMLSLNVGYIMENNPGFFEDPTQYKKSTKSGFAAKIFIESKTGCLKFSGFFDGLSVVQTPGGMEYTAIIKNRFQVLNELYPKLMGIYPGSVPVTRMVPNLKCVAASTEYTTIDVGGISVSANTSPVEFYLKLLEAIVQSQENPGAYCPLTQDLSSVRQLLEKTSYKDNVQLCKQLIKDIDTTNAKTPDWQVKRDLVYHTNLLLSTGEDVWDTLLGVMADAGCVLLPGDSKLFVVPQSNFLNLDGSCPSVEEQSTSPNQAYPADYSNFVLNDNSFKNIKYCVVHATGFDAFNVNRGFTGNLNLVGMYPKEDKDVNPDDGASGILAIPAPPWIGRTIGGSVWIHTKTLSSNQSNAYPQAGAKKDVDKVDDGKDAVESASEQIKQKISEDKATEKLLDNYAKARFLTEKYIERTGSFSLQFNPKWVPATTGFLASRQPKVMFNFYVTGVTHTIATNGGRGGTASTQVTFNSARYAGNSGSIPGVESNELYNYDSGKMSSLQNRWLSDIEANYKPQNDD